MKVKYSWIPFIPVAVIMLLLKTFALLFSNEYGNFLGLNFVKISYIGIILALFIFLVCAILNIIDKKTAPVYAADRNLPAAIFSLVSGAFVLASSTIVAIENANGSEYFMIYVVDIVLALMTAIAFVFLGKVHFTGNSMVSLATYLYIFIPFWACSELITCFFESTKVSVASTDMTELFCYIFITLYLFVHAMVISRIQVKNPVKASTLYGFTAAALSSMQGIYLLVSAFKGGYNGVYMLKGLMFVFLAAYIIAFLTELTRNLLNKNEIEMIEELPEYESTNGVITDGYDDYVFENNNSNSAKSDDEEYDDTDEEELEIVEETEEDEVVENTEEISEQDEVLVNDGIFGLHTNVKDEENPIIYDNNLSNDTLEEFFLDVAEPVDEKNIEIIEKKEPVIPVSTKNVEDKSDEPEEIDSKDIFQKKVVIESDGKDTHKILEDEEVKSSTTAEKKQNDRMSEIDKLIAELEKENN